ncbi:methylmalonyl Co-A mutase-associated GTPase MeaB [Clostridium sp. HV4-5-A1G]|jgi:LAO/AO transport system kinase|uniref:methylmalonyl Co-A mutase-associated GTPase MeaB n=1 Tax=Clostridium sp. HV4-5-A1G TaxID=2004595 RepID=UPI00123B955F|nr:methylmalonyl Co-A mutase-associated GTPase MeaB [Clostridium sp. HV4-5-A1G]KAA8669898.1 methylmalonyl Co-A mutase-associated GTPase MeaB [Clostridium sp. HV4-5-A1G]CAB1251925.1 Putative GTPase [Clostridiaceae bacterium BL-3]
MDIEDIKRGIMGGRKRAAAKLITMMENEDSRSLELMKDLYHLTGKARVIGITGPPGAGKSTVTDQIAKLIRKQGKKVGIIAVDPTSPFSHGAILGDRVRMNDLNTDEGVFIRSMGTRGALGGLSDAVYGTVNILDIFGMDYIFIETVGVGQSEVDIVKVADVVVMVMVPGLGDDIQTMKAGIMEIGDIFAVNKSDKEGAQRTAAEIEAMLSFNDKGGKLPPVLNITAKDNTGIDRLLSAIDECYDSMASEGVLEERRKSKLKDKIISILKNNLVRSALKLDYKTGMLKRLVEDVFNKKMDPYTASDTLYKNFKMGDEK